jgi:hypothetical protein
VQGEAAERRSRAGSVGVVRPRTLRPALLAATLSVVATLLWIWWAHRRGAAWSIAILVTAFSLQVAALWLLRGRRDGAGLRPARWLAAGAVVLAALAPLHGSRDLYLYDLYGRALGVHHTNPFTTAPSELKDPVEDLVATRWHSQPSLYGPGFVTGAAVVAMAAGTSELAIRLAWQAVAAAAALVAVALVARSTRDPAAVVALGASPVLLLAVNDAHNDVLLGTLLLGAVLLVRRTRVAGGGGLAAIALTVKLVVLIPLVGLVTWIAMQRGHRAVVRFVVPVVGAVGIAYLLAGGGRALEPLRLSSGNDSRFALWQHLRATRMEELLAHGMGRIAALETVRAEMANWAILVGVVVLVVVLWRFRHAARPGEVCVAAGLVGLLSSVYVMPWYAAALVPVAATVWSSRAARLAWVQGAFVVLAYAEGTGHDPTTSLGLLLERRAPVIVASMLAVLVVWVAPSQTHRWPRRGERHPDRRAARATAAGAPG